jgi:dihydroxyacetone kinase phosphoprotein-dependent L subunit
MTADLRARILAACDAVEAHRDELGRLDAVAGDGDHGVSMALGARAVRTRLEANPDASGPALLTLIAPAAASVGGAIGPIWATMLVRAGAAAASAGVGGHPTVAQLSACADAALAGVQALGKARPGDKTLVDALAPVALALAHGAESGLGVAEVADAAVAAADAGAEATAGMVATLGRASRLGDRSLGSMDPGVRSLAIVLRAVVEAEPDARSEEG